MHLRRLRLEKGWSQEQLADMAGISTRTLQRIERGANASPETLKCLAAVLEADFKNLQQETPMPDADFHKRELAALEYVRDIKGFYTHLITYLIATTILALFNLIFTPGYFWVGWTYLGWGIGVLIHGLNVFELFSFFGPDWERRQVKKHLQRQNR